MIQIYILILVVYTVNIEFPMIRIEEVFAPSVLTPH